MDDRLFKLGDILPNSVVWLDGVRTTEELNGVCAMRIAYPEDKYVVQAVSNLGKTASKLFGITPNRIPTIPINTCISYQDNRV